MKTESFINQTAGTLNDERSQIATKTKNCFQNITLLIIAAMITSICLIEPGVSVATEANQENVRKLAEEYSQEEKARHASELLALGDQLSDQKDYDSALAAYEQIFMFDPANAKASAKIDLLRKQMGKEGKDEGGIVKAVYEQEAAEKVRGYWADVQTYLKQRRMGQARLALEKILILDPMNEEAGKLYEQLKQPSAVSPDETGKTL